MRASCSGSSMVHQVLEWLILYTFSLSNCKTIKYCQIHFLRVHVILFVGIMEYYHEMLIDVIQYPDLRTDVFQSFREIGNAILLTLLMEQLLVMNVVVIFIHYDNSLAHQIKSLKYALQNSCHLPVCNSVHFLQKLSRCNIGYTINDGGG